VLAAALDRVVAWDRIRKSGPWVTSIQPGIGVRAYPGGSPARRGGRAPAVVWPGSDNR
jgi:hypothetical protein